MSCFSFHSNHKLNAVIIDMLTQFLSTIKKNICCQHIYLCFCSLSAAKKLQLMYGTVLVYVIIFYKDI